MARAVTSSSNSMPSATDWQSISQPSASPQPDEQDWQPISAASSLTVAPPAKPTNLLASNPFSVLGSAISSGAKQIADAAKSSFGYGVAGADKFQTAKNPLELGEAALQTGAGAAGVLGSPLAPVLKPAGDAANAAADKISNSPAVQNFAMSPAGATTARAAEDVGNAAALAGAVAVPEAAEGPSLSETAASASKASAALSDKLSAISPYKTTADLQAAATANINKALSNTGKASATGLLSRDSARLSGLENLYKLTKDQPIARPDGTVAPPLDLTHLTDPHDFLSAFVQAKNQLWSKVEVGLKTGAAVKPDYAPVISQLQDTIQNSASKALVQHAQSRLQEVKTLASQGVQGAQRYLQEELNPRIGAAISGASDAPALKLDATLAKGINNALDKGLSTVKDASIRPFKDQYASLKSIEPDIVRMIQKSVRAPGGGIPQYINDFANINLLEAAFAHNPGLYLAKAGGMKVLSKVLATQRDPLDHLSKAFQAIKSYTDQRPALPTPNQ
jgi:hypothetical protein